MLRLELQKISKREFIGVYGQCRDCGSPVSRYPNHRGEGVFQNDINWEVSIPHEG